LSDAVLLVAAAFLLGLWQPCREAAGALRRGEVDIDLLMILVAVGAWLLGHPGEGIALLVLFNGSRAMEAYARQRTRSALSSLLADLPAVATTERGVISVELVRVGDVLVIRPGERLVADAEVVEGESSADLSALTGESAPRLLAPGAEVPSGAVNGGGLLRARVVRAPEESAWQKIIHLVEQAPERHSPAQQLASRAGKVFTVAILSITALAYCVWLLGGVAPSDAAYRAMALLVAGSPCAIVLSIPSAVLAAIAGGLRHGVLFNGGVGLGALGRVKHMAFDKTGTLSNGLPGVVNHRGDLTRAEGAIALALAEASTHPASRAVERYLRELWPDLSPAALSRVSEDPGEGMRGEAVDGSTCRLGRLGTVEAMRLDGNLGSEERELGRVAFRANSTDPVLFFLAESPRSDAAEALRGVERLGVRPVILSGDAAPAVRRMALKLAVNDAHAELRPEEKWAAIRQLKGTGGVAMVGDGINDVPALAAADVSIAMGIRGSAAALSQADVVLTKDELLGIVPAIELARRADQVIWQNLALAIGAASVMTAFALAGSLPLAVGVLGHEGGTVLVVLNSLRLLGEGWTFRKGTPLRRPATAG
jgi:Cd2+/Zn2+-exporting ATPase